MHRFRMSRMLVPALAVLVAGCPGDATPDPPIERDWSAIAASDTLTVLTTFNSTSYFLYRGEPMGLEYELLSRFARAHDLQIRTVVVANRDEMLDMLARGEGDVVGGRVIPERDQHERVAFSRLLYETPPALVQRVGPAGELGLPESVDTLISVPGGTAGEPIGLRVRRIAEPGQLAGEEVWIAEGSAYWDRLLEISDSITGDIEVVQVEGDVRTEALIRRVAAGEIELALAPENLASLSAAYFENVEATPVLGPGKGVAFAVRSNSTELLQRLNGWLDENEPLTEQLYQRYFIDRRGYRERVASDYLTSETGRLSPYDDLFRRHALLIGWDWRLLASQAYQESQFNPNALSWAGAVGLLQLMPRTARVLGVRDSRNPEQNVSGAVRFIRDLTARWDTIIADPDQRLRFILASYNVGPGHVDDARRLTDHHGGDSQQWSEVAYWLLQKSTREVYTHPVVRHGFARGLEPVAYVGHVLDRYEHYRQFVRDPPEPERPTTPGS